MPNQFPILLVDDDPLLLDNIKRDAQYTFAEARFLQVYNSQEAIAYIKALHGNGPKLILLDINLQGNANGFSFLKFLQSHAQARFIAVAILTVSQLKAYISVAYSAGASSFTVKPFSFDEWILYLKIYDFTG